MTYLVFGKSGQVSTALQNTPADLSKPLHIVSSEALDLGSLTSPDVILNLIDAHNISAVLNPAAYTNVDRAESEPELAEAVNAIAPLHIAAACEARNIPLVHVSTDFVFSGDATRPYTEDDFTKPLSVYGKTKLAGEDAIIASGCNRAIIRTAWVFSETGSNFVKTMLRLGQEREALSVVADQQGTPTPASAIALIMPMIAEQLTHDPSKSGTYHFTGDEQTSWAGFARAIFEEAGLSTQVNDITTADYPTPAKRPAWSVLDCTRIRETFRIPQPSWRSALRSTITTLKQS